MGRPINKRFFGEPTPGGNEIKVQFHNGTSSVDGWIIKQLATRKFRCTDGTAIADCVLVDVAAASLAAGEMSISVKDDAGTVTRIVKIAARKVTTSAGDSIAWNFTDSAVDGAVEMEEAGDGIVPDVIAITAAANATLYEIVDAGDTDFTLIGSADSNVGTQFTSDNSVNSFIGTGTVQEPNVSADTFGL